MSVSGLFQVVYIEYDEQRELAVRKSFVENSYQFELDLSRQINVNCPVTILHGVKDEDVPYEVSRVLSGGRISHLSIFLFEFYEIET